MFLCGQPPAEPPAWVQSAPDFYGAVAGGDLSVTLTASVTELPRDADFTLTLTVSNVRNSRAVRRPPLAKLPAFADLFQITDAVSPEPTDREVRFVWTARPKVDGKVEVPGLKFAYFNPARPDGKLPTKITPTIQLTVRPPAPPPSVVDPLPAGDRLFALPDAGDGFRPRPGWWVGGPAMLGGLAAGWVVVWRRWNPDGARLARLRRVRSVRRVLDRLTDAERSADPAGAAAVAVRDYLIERYGVPVVGPVPAEVDAAMRAAGLPGDRATAAGEFFRACDVVRFDGSGPAVLPPSPGSVGEGLGVRVLIPPPNTERAAEPRDGPPTLTANPSPTEPGEGGRNSADLPAVARRLVLSWEDA